MIPEKRHAVMVKFTEDEFKFILRYQSLKLRNCLKLNPPAIKLTNGDTVRMIINEFILLYGKNLITNEFIQLTGKN